MMNCILTDCFDTLICRREHPYQVFRRWAKCVSNLYPSVNADKLFSERMRLMKIYSVDADGIYRIYEELCETFNGKIEDNQNFVRDCRKFELACQESTAYINRKVDKYLRKKKDCGCKIYCVTDYHLSSEDMATFLSNVGIDYIDGVFSSASFGVTKCDGGLYAKVKGLLNIESALMIGDNKISDIRNAQRNGLKTKYIANTFWHKQILRIKNKFGMLPKQTAYTIGKQLWQDSDSYEEFTLIFFTFCSRLYRANKGKKKIVFLAREGYFLKICFDLFQTMCIPKEERIGTDYLKCSRRAIFSVQRDKCFPESFTRISVVNYFISVGFTQEEAIDMAQYIGIESPQKVIENFASSNEAKAIRAMLGPRIEERIAENKRAFEKYVRSKINGNELILVDVGWTGRMQQGIDCLLDEVSTKGFYIGIYDNLNAPPPIERHGLVFDCSDDGIKSAYFHIFRSNIQLYEQLLAAPHGSACFYKLDEKQNPVVVEKWDENEKCLYFDVIEGVQRKLLNNFESLCTFNFDGINDNCYDEKSIYNKDLAQTMLKSCLVQSKNRMNFLKKLIAGFSQNFQQASVGLQFNANKIKERKRYMLVHPDRFVRYFAKLSVAMDKKCKWGGGISRSLMKVYYGWARFVLTFK